MNFSERATSFSSRVSPRWEAPGTVENFRTATPNEDLMRYARELQARHRSVSAQPMRVLDIGGGAGRNAVPLARLGMDVVCTDLSSPMLRAAQTKLLQEDSALPMHLVEA